MRAILRDAATSRWRLFERPRELVVAQRLDEVIPALRHIELATSSGMYAAGFLAYEASPAFDPALHVQPDGRFPLLWFGLYDAFHELPDEAVESSEDSTELPGGWIPSVDGDRYAAVFETLQELIRSGETYQVNFTYRLRAPMTSSPWALFQHLVSAQKTDYGAYMHAGEWVVCSASPELFFEKNGTTVISKPMKGTAARGLWFEQDREQAERLRSSPKERAENVMIVDMVRNDLGRIARPGTVQVPVLFDVERYPTVWQMTSTVVAETDVSLTEVMTALFPAASITGAPKSSTMGIIARVECSPRRIYTGTIGFVDPGGRAQFNVAIRTLLFNRKEQTAEYGIGGGIVVDSSAVEEQAEAELKSRVLGRRDPDFELLETMVWTPREGFALLDLHLKRLAHSAQYFGFDIHVDDVRNRLVALAEMQLRSSGERHRVRLQVSRRGNIDVKATRLADDQDGFGTVVMAAEPVDPRDPFLYHKTTHRLVYERALELRPGASDVLLFNNRRELTESTIANLVVEFDGLLVTPPVECGLLPGTAREQLLARGRARERRVQLDDLANASRVYLINSVRGMHEVTGAISI